MNKEIKIFYFINRFYIGEELKATEESHYRLLTCSLVMFRSNI